jgi:hypothetical protein
MCDPNTVPNDGLLRANRRKISEAEKSALRAQAYPHEPRQRFLAGGELNDKPLWTPRHARRLDIVLAALLASAKPLEDKEK